jgi:ribosomal protein S18 acetylase RimI-like enzyme/2'-5' RNA ligase
MAGSDNSNSVVIVALPAENDLVRKVSSEPEPHLTLCYLGNAEFTPEQLAHVTDYVEYASSMLNKFSLDVVTRGELGDKNADVLFFNKKWSENISRFRDQLLQDPLINAAYNDMEQYPDWMPHLTLGYPETPAKKSEQDFGEFYNVRFDRIAVWTGDSAGPTFPLQSYDYDLEVVMSQTTEESRAVVEDFLAHLGDKEMGKPVEGLEDFNLEDEYGDLLDLLDTYIGEVEPTVEHFGVKGMKWGVRKDRPDTEPLKSLGPDSVSRKTKSGETITLQKVQASKFQEFLGRHSKGFREEYSKQASLNILDSSGKKVGDAMVQKRSKDELYLEWLGINKSERGKGYASAVMKAGRDFGKQEGFKKMVLEVPGNSPDARHIYENLGFKYIGEANGGAKDPIWGGLSQMEYDFGSAKHSEDSVSAFLAHYGIKGMKWGVRRVASESGSSPKPTASSDAKLASAAQTKINSGGIKSASNHEIQLLVNRMNLERQYSQLQTQQKSSLEKGNQLTQKILKTGKTVEDVRRFLETPTGKVVKNTLKGAFAAGKVAAAGYSGGASAAAGVGAGLAVRRAANHYTNVGR